MQNEFGSGFSPMRLRALGGERFGARQHRFQDGAVLLPLGLSGGNGEQDTAGGVAALAALAALPRWRRCRRGIR